MRAQVRSVALDRKGWSSPRDSGLWPQSLLFETLHPFRLQVRSVTLDTKVWERSVVALFESVGNTVSNAIWEENLDSRPAAAGAAHGGGGGVAPEAWVMCSGPGGDDGEAADFRCRLQTQSP